MRKVIGGLVAALLLIPLPSQAQECAEGYIHVMPYCFSPDELTVYLTSQVETIAPSPVYVDPVGQWEPLVRKYWPAELVGWALRIIECESGGDPDAKNRSSTAAGLFQFLRSTWDRGPAPALGLPAYWTGAPYVAEWNIQAAAWLYANWGGKSQWSCKSFL